MHDPDDGWEADAGGAADDLALPGTLLSVPVPPDLAATFGYPGEARFVGFFWEPGGDEIIYDDRRLSGTGDGYAFLAYRRHPAVAVHLKPYNLGSSDEPAEYYLVLDKQSQRASVAPKAMAHAFLEEQHPPPQELTPYEEVELAREAESILDAVEEDWQEVQVDSEAVRQAMARQHEAIAGMIAYLDHWSLPADQRNQP